MGQRLLREGWFVQMDARMMITLTLALLCATAPLELSQIAFALVGAVVYALLSSLQLSTIGRSTKAGVSTYGRAAKADAAAGKLESHPRALAACRSQAAASSRQSPSTGERPTAGQQLFWQAAQTPQTPPQGPRTAPAQTAGSSLALNLFSDTWDEQVEELLRQIAPTDDSDRIVQQLARVVKQALRRSMPEAEVSGFASGDLVRGAAFGMAVPEVDIVVSVTPQVLAARLQGRLAPRGSSAAQLEVRKLLKSAIRACTDRLVQTGGFKFRRSAFRGQEPKVTLLAPASLGICNEAIPVDFSVNSTTPLYNAALVEQCRQMDPRAKALILLVKRWAKDRGICHAAKGHLPPYAWSLLTVYFLQVGDPTGSPVLPALAGFKMPRGLTVPPLVGEPAEAPAASCKSQLVRTTEEHETIKSVGMLFKDFVHFYSKKLQWDGEVISVRTGRRSPPATELPLHMILHEDGITTEVGPSIEDPFEPKRNLGECTTAASLARMHEELTRAEELCAADASLVELLEPWVPPERVTAHRLREEEEDYPEDVNKAAAARGQCFAATA